MPGESVHSMPIESGEKERIATSHPWLLVAQGLASKGQEGTVDNLLPLDRFKQNTLIGLSPWPTMIVLSHSGRSQKGEGIAFQLSTQGRPS